tara:strand:+ start:663 stop:1043 length:381 start_codon:yes stop_codon:yes gene_type:complete
LYIVDSMVLTMAWPQITAPNARLDRKHRRAGVRDGNEEGAPDLGDPMREVFSDSRPQCPVRDEQARKAVRHQDDGSGALADRLIQRLQPVGQIRPVPVGRLESPASDLARCPKRLPMSRAGTPYTG